MMAPNLYRAGVRLAYQRFAALYPCQPGEKGFSAGAMQEVQILKELRDEVEALIKNLEVKHG